MKFSHAPRYLILVFSLGLLFMPGDSAFAANDAMLDLLKILRDKGSLTAEEYELLRETAIGDNGEKSEAPGAPAGKSGWTERFKLKGDVRVRYQDESEDPGVDRGRGRVRYRLGVIASPADGWEAGAGLASGSSDPRSTNQSFDDTFSSKGINLDYAYAQYRFNEYWRGIAGKFKPDDYLYMPTDLMWDGDINPEGFSVNLARKNRLGMAFANGGVWVLEENSASNDDPHMIYGQVGQAFDSDRMFAAVAGTYYTFREINALGDIATDGSNTDYRFEGAWSLGGELGMRNFLDRGIKASLIAEWVRNSDTITSDDSGYAFGVKAARNAWSFKYIYADLETNAWPDILPDSDRFGGLTGIDGHEFVLGYDLMKNVSLGLDYYNVDSDSGISQDLLQFDVIVKF